MEHKNLRTAGRMRPGFAAGLMTALPRAAALFGHPAVTLAATLVLQFAAALLLAQGRLLGRFAPLGAAFTAAAVCFPFSGRSGGRLLPGAALLGAVTGSLLAGGAADGARYAAAAILCFAAGLILRGAVWPGRHWLPSLAAGGALLLTDAVYLAAAPRGTGELLLLGCEAVLAAGAARCYLPVLSWLYGAREDKREKPPNSAAREPLSGTRRQLAAAAAGLSLVLALADAAPFFGMSLGRLTALFLTLSAAGAAGPLSGCAAGLLSGLAADLALSGMPSLAAVYAAAGLTAGAVRRRGTLWTALGFTLGHGAMLPWVWPAAPAAVLWECFAAGVIWYLSGRRVTAALQRCFADTACAAAGGPADMESARSKLRALTAAFETVGEAVRVPPQPPAEPVAASAFDLAVERVCRNCDRRETCWRTEYQSTRTALNEAAEKIRSRGRAHGEDFPPWFAARCEHLGDFSACVNETLALRESRSRYRRRAADDTRLLGAQVEATTRVLTEICEAVGADGQTAEEETRELRRALNARGLALQPEVLKTGGRYSCRVRTAAGLSRNLEEALEDLCGTVTGRRMRVSGREGDCLLLREAELYHAAVGVSLRQRRGEAESGDSTACFRTEDGRLCLVLADGMGSGRDAARESAAFVRMLEGFLKAGVTVRTALELLAPVFAVKCGGDTFTTCDVFSVDLRSGEGACYKCGAAPTYICSASGRGVRRISSGSMPVGIPSEAPAADYIGLRLEIGDIVVMASDGLTENGDDAWLTALLADSRFTTAPALAAAILDAGAARNGGRDDVSVLVLKLSAARL